MDIRAELLQGYSKEGTQRIADYIGADAERLEYVLQLFLNDENRVVQRASWVLSVCAEKHPELIMPHLEVLVKNLRQPKLHNAVKRNTVRILQDVDIPENLWGEVADICFQYLADPKEAVAVRVFSMTVLLQICQKVPELMNELQLTIEEYMPHGSAGFQSRGKKTLAAIQKWRTAD